MEHAGAYVAFIIISASQYTCHRLSEHMRAKQKDGVQFIIHGVHGSAIIAVASHPVTIETIHEWLIHFFIYSH